MARARRVLDLLRERRVREVRLAERGVPYDTALCNAALSTLASAGRSADAHSFMLTRLGAYPRAPI